MMLLKLENLPDELLEQIIYELPFDSVLYFQSTCRRFRELDSGLLWRALCTSGFSYWADEWDIEAKLRLPAESVDWKTIYISRIQKHQEVKRALDSLVSNQYGRIEKTKAIVAKGYDIKDALIEQLRTGENAPDVLARRWHINSVLGCLHRSTAIRTWKELMRTPDAERSLERALASFDLFVLKNDAGDVRETSNMLDSIADQIRLGHPNLDGLSRREKSMLVASYLREHRLVGIDEEIDSHYHDLENNFIGHALREEPHSSLPLISVAIFCFVARRLGLDAHPCGYPFHVMAIVLPSQELPSGFADPLTDAMKQPFYLDPFRSSDACDVDSLVVRLQSMGIPDERHAGFMSAAPNTEIVARCARNVSTSVQMSQRQSTTLGSLSIELATYASLWARLVVLDEASRRQPALDDPQFLSHLVRHIRARYVVDCWILEDLLEDVGPQTPLNGAFKDFVRSLRLEDKTLKAEKHRTVTQSPHVSYHVGQVFCHQRYQYHAIIIGWDSKCEASEEWMAQMRIHDLSRGKHQSFYHALVEDDSLRYVAEENIKIIKTAPIPGLLNIAGRYMKRWDDEGREFVSNMLQEYPNG